ncbi:class I SAM-dependent methyltransferase [Streptomyces sp. CRN 30]|uniref:class I SAM-dependent methyltransferase n=1 Tax=Streptomyces sp. CRN 30 TaxID=3075613 RepID=UPI002A83BF50|nr:class I SAM-dependent methyltransferase [Streptomyces sp. CRN 30]
MTRQLDEQIAGRFPVGQRLRVLDVGMGRGAQALRLARAGHAVTGLERDPERIAVARETLAAQPEGVRGRVRVVEGDGRDTGVHFLPGSFDVVLCHGVLPHVAEPDPLLAGLARMLAPGGLLSLVVRNGDAAALRTARAGDWAGTLAAFDAPAHAPRVPAPLEPGESRGGPGAEVWADRLGALTATLAGIGAPLHAWYGVRVFTESAGEGTTLPQNPQHTVALLAAEERAGRTDPYRRVAALLHLCGVRG